MNPHYYTLRASAVAATILDHGFGRVERAAIWPAASSAAKKVAFLDSQDNLIFEVTMDDLPEPDFAIVHSFSFINGLKIKNENCDVDLIVSY